MSRTLRSVAMDLPLTAGPICVSRHMSTHSMSSSHPDEEQRLVRRLLAGEESAFTEFFNEYFPRLYRFALARVRNEEDTRDIVQETLSRAMQRISGYRGEAALFTWLCQICRSRISDYFAAAGRRQQHVVLAEDHPAIAASLESIRLPDSDPETQLRREQALRHVQVVLDGLPVKYGNALHWKYIEGIPVQTIAERMGVPFLAAQSTLQRAREAFRDAFESLSAGTAQDVLLGRHEDDYR
jgi:RNA polymerase sigma-70 factor, ECF subfamily